MSLNKEPRMGVRFVTHTYCDGMSISTQWSEELDGPWPYSNDVYNVEIKHMGNFLADTAPQVTPERVETDLVWHKVGTDVVPPQKEKVIVCSYADGHPWIRYVQGQFLKNLTDAEWWAYLNDPKPLI